MRPRPHLNVVRVEVKCNLSASWVRSHLSFNVIGSATLDLNAKSEQTLQISPQTYCALFTQCNWHTSLTLYKITASWLTALTERRLNYKSYVAWELWSATPAITGRRLPRGWPTYGEQFLKSSDFGLKNTSLMWRKEAKTEEEEMHFQILRSYPLCDFSLSNALKCESAVRLSSRPVIFFNRWWRFSINFPTRQLLRAAVPNAWLGKRMI